MIGATGSPAGWSCSLKREAGVTKQEVLYRKGSPEDPMMQSEIEVKFGNLAQSLGAWLDRPDHRHSVAPRWTGSLIDDSRPPGAP